MALNFRESIQSADPFDLLTSYKVNQPARKSCQVGIYSRNNIFILFYSLLLVKKYMTLLLSMHVKNLVIKERILNQVRKVSHINGSQEMS